MVITPTIKFNIMPTQRSQNYPLFYAIVLLLFCGTPYTLSAYDFNTAVDTLPSNCYAVSDLGNPNVLFIYDKATDMWNNIGSTGVNAIEAVAFNPIDGMLYAVNGGTFGTIDLTTAAFVASGGSLGTASGSLGNISINDIDGLTYDPYQDVFWASQRRNSGTNHDLLVQINATTGMLVQNAFGANVDYVIMQEVFDTEINQLVYDIDDVAIDPQSGKLYGIANQGGSGGMLTIFDKTDGTVDQVVGSFNGIDDMEALGFFSDGSLFGATGNNGPDPADNNKYYRLDKSTGNVLESTDIDPSGTQVDFEACDCLSGAPNQITGVVDLGNSCPCADLMTWNDIVINLYSDDNGNGIIDLATDVLINTDTINNGETFNFQVVSTGNFIINLDSVSMPTSFSYVGTTNHTAFFDDLDQTDSGNNFEFCSNIAPALITSTCNDNGTNMAGNDDYLVIEVNAENDGAGASNQYEIYYNGFLVNTGGTTYGTPFILGNGGEFPTDSGTDYTFTFRDSDNASCEMDLVVPGQQGCSLCRQICLPIEISHN